MENLIAVIRDMTVSSAFALAVWANFRISANNREIEKIIKSLREKDK